MSRYKLLERFIATSEKLLPIIKDPEKKGKFKCTLNTWKEKLNIMAKKIVQQKFDALIAAHGAEAVITAINSHVQPNASATCPEVPCSSGYYCSGGVCKLDVGKK